MSFIRLVYLATYQDVGYPVIGLFLITMTSNLQKNIQNKTGSGDNTPFGIKLWDFPLSFENYSYTKNEDLTHIL